MPRPGCSGRFLQPCLEHEHGPQVVLGGRVITWSTSDANVATVDQTGLVRGVGPGSATITATSEGQSGTAAITVTP